MKEYLAPDMTVVIFRTEGVLTDPASLPTPGNDETPIGWRDVLGN